MKESYSLYDLNEYLRRVVALNFTEPIWIRCEISQCSESRGNYYLNLIEKDDNHKIIAKSNASIWYKTTLYLKNKLKDLFGSILSDGTEVLIRANIEFHEVYGLSLNIVDIDPSYTIGQMEIQRQKIVKRLEDEGLVYLNQRLQMPNVIQHIAVISSKTAAGYADFINQIEHNEYGYDIKHDLYHVAVQGDKMEGEILNALMKIDLNSEEYDCVVIIRGGGSKLDLAGFDSYEIAYRIAKTSIPVITGIGHEVDDTVADLVAHTAVKTPTAAAVYIIDTNLQYEMLLTDAFQQIVSRSKQKMEWSKLGLDKLQTQLHLIPRQLLAQAKGNLDILHNALQYRLSHTLTEKKNNLSRAEQLIKISSPEYVLSKGYFIIKKDNKSISDLSLLDIGDLVTVQGRHHEMDATINSKRKK